MNINNIAPTRVYLVGFMASGKTTLGKKLANRLKYEFVDLDEKIEEEAGRSISDIFNIEGEATFRQLEANTLRKTIDLSKSVIATGGGTPCYHDNMTWIKENGKSIYLFLSPDRLLGRLRTQKAHRPMIADLEDEELKEFIQQLLEKREPIYQTAHFIVDVDQRISETVQDMTRIFI